MSAPVPGTALPWQYRDDYTTEGFVTIIGNVDGEYVDGRAECTYDVVCRCEDEFGERLPSVAANVRYLVHAANNFPALLKALQTIVGHYADQTLDGNAPGHGHLIPGIWDASNPPHKAGKPCEWCAQWNAARQAIASATGEA